MVVKRAMLLIVGICGSTLVGCFLVMNTGGNSVVRNDPTIAEVSEILAPLNFPYNIPDTYLVLRDIVMYEGPYMEDGSNDYVVNVAAIIVENTAKFGVENATVTLCWLNGQYRFEVQMLPPGESVLVLDTNRQKYIKRQWTACAGEQQAVDQLSWKTNIQVIEKDDLISLKNTSQEEYENINIYYKAYLTDENLYLGGRVQCFQVDRLDGYEFIQIRPYGYLSDYAKVLSLRIDTG